PGSAVEAVVGPPDPAVELAVEASRVLEAPAGQEARLHIAVGPLHQPLRLGIGALAQPRPHAQRPPEALEGLGEDHPASPPLSDGALLVPDHPAGPGPELV